MAEIEKNEVAKLIDVIKSFNDKVWVRLASEINGLYSNNTSQVTLNQDVAPATSGDITIVSRGIPQMNKDATIGVNTKTATGSIPKKDALPREHMQTLNGNERKFFTLKFEDISSKESYPTITAKDVYEACYEVLRQLLSIRPLTTIWNHEGLSAFSNAEFKYHAVYKDSGDSALDELTVNGKKVPKVDHGQHAVSGYQGSYYEWSGYSKGANFSIFSAYDETKPSNAKIVSRTIEKDTKVAAINMNDEINAFWRAWEDKCKTSNRFTYTYHSCHLSCHSSCYCYGARHRR